MELRLRFNPAVTVWALVAGSVALSIPNPFLWASRQLGQTGLSVERPRFCVNVPRQTGPASILPPPDPQTTSLLGVLWVEGLRTYVCERDSQTGQGSIQPRRSTLTLYDLGLVIVSDIKQSGHSELADRLATGPPPVMAFTSNMRVVQSGGIFEQILRAKFTRQIVEAPLRSDDDGRVKRIWRNVPWTLWRRPNSETVTDIYEVQTVGGAPGAIINRECTTHGLPPGLFNIPYVGQYWIYGHESKEDRYPFAKPCP